MSKLSYQTQQFSKAGKTTACQHSMQKINFLGPFSFFSEVILNRSKSKLQHDMHPIAICRALRSHS